MNGNNMADSSLLVTGQAGFVGQHALLQWPYASGLEGANGAIDILDKAALLQHFSHSMPNQVLHLAALSFVPDSFKAPEKTFEVNVF